MEWLVYILLGIVIVQQIQIIEINNRQKKFLNFIKSQDVLNKTICDSHKRIWENLSRITDAMLSVHGIRVDNTLSNEEGNGSINPSEADTGLCHEVSRQK